MKRQRLYHHRWPSLLVLLLVCGMQFEFGSSVFVAAYYAPGMTPKYYAAGDRVDIHVNSLHSQETVFPTEYYFLPFCRPEKIRKMPGSSLAELFSGDQRLNSLYSLNMLESTSCKVLSPCNIENNTKEILTHLDDLDLFINQGYRAQMTIDNLPLHNDGTSRLAKGSCSKEYLKRKRSYGYDIGVPTECTGKALLNNYLSFTVYYNTNPLNSSEFMVVGLSAVPSSFQFLLEKSCSDSNPRVFQVEPLGLEDIQYGASVVWAYGVEWVKSDVVWATRWDAYFYGSIAGSHAVPVVFILSVVLIISGVVLAILSRFVFRDLRRYELMDSVSSVVECPMETGWKLLHADVFRPPLRSGLFSILVGNGSQVLGLLFVVLLLANMGLLSPARRGSLLTAVLLLMSLMAVCGGFVCGYMLSYFNLRKWKYIYLCGSCASGVLISLLIVADLFYATQSSSDSLSFVVILLLFVIWLAVNLPLTIIGAAFSFRLTPMKNPVRARPLAREIPKGSWMSNKVYLFFVPALAPLFTLFLQLHFMMQGLWTGQMYCVFNFVTVNFILWVFVVGLVTVSHIYYLLRKENHRWWWWSVIIPGSCGADMMLYAVYFYFTQITLRSFASMVLYFIYMSIISVAYGLAAGTVGFVSSFFFIQVLYTKLRVN